MKTTLSENEFITLFQEFRPNNFSYEGLSVLFEYFEEYERDTGIEIEFDPIAICCEYEELHYSDIIGQYETGIECLDNPTEEDMIDYITTWLHDQTSVVGESSEGTFVFLQF